MSTRCKIGIMGEGGKIRGVYCHHDGYPSHVGALLLRYYNQPDGINKLISLGSLDSLGCRLDGKQGNITQAFHRDLGEILVIDEYGSEAEFNKKDREEEFVKFPLFNYLVFLLTERNHILKLFFYPY